MTSPAAEDGPARDPASFRDPAGHVYVEGGRVLRSVSAGAARGYEFVRDRGLLKRWHARGWIVSTEEVAPPPGASSTARYWLEHERIPFVSYPYEWPFAALKAAALRHLDLQRDALEAGVALSDATAYNVQFRGARPVFIDILSFRPYEEGEYWTGYRQFCQQFLNPLLLRACAGIAHNAWFRGALEGIGARDLNAVLPLRSKLSWTVLSHVSMAARLEARATRAGRATRPPSRPLRRSAYAALLMQLRGAVARLTPRGHTDSTWSGYEESHTYAGEAHAGKRAFVERFVARARPAMLWDIGCNTGEYAELACRASDTTTAVGFDADHGALDRAFARAEQRQLPFLPLYLDAANPSPNQGWNEAERRGLAGRGPASALLALAFVHHLAIGRNIPLPHVVRWLTALAPTGVIEFVPKSDPTVQLMLSQRQDVFTDYSDTTFTAALSSAARIVQTEAVSSNGRRLYWYER
jgi:ribosomal protein L11 methylase PrmA